MLTTQIWLDGLLMKRRQSVNLESKSDMVFNSSMKFLCKHKIFLSLVVVFSVLVLCVSCNDKNKSWVYDPETQECNDKENCPPEMWINPKAVAAVKNGNKTYRFLSLQDALDYVYDPAEYEFYKGSDVSFKISLIKNTSESNGLSLVSNISDRHITIDLQGYSYTLESGNFHIGNAYLTFDGGGKFSASFNVENTILNVDNSETELSISGFKASGNSLVKVEEGKISVDTDNEFAVAKEIYKILDGDYEVEITQHNHSYSGKEVLSPTCLRGGYTYEGCDICGYRKKSDFSEVLGHSFADTVTTPTCTAKGYTTHKCKRCDYETVDTFVEPLGHDWSLIPDKDGFYTCQRCKQKKTTKLCAMLYFCLSNLTTYGYDNLNTICSVTPTDEVRLFLMTGGSSISASPDASEYPYLCRALGNPGLMKPDTEQYWEFKYDEVKGYGVLVPMEDKTKGMGDKNILKGFINRCYAQTNGCVNCNYVLDLWDHGAGSARGMFLDYVVDENQTSLMTLADLKYALEENDIYWSGKKFIDIILELCLMQSLEMAKIMAPYAEYMVGSENNTSAYGTDYAAWVKYMYDFPTTTGLALGEKLCSTAIPFLERHPKSDYDKQTTWSAIDLSKIQSVIDAFEVLAVDVTNLLNSEKGDSFKNALSESVKFDEDYGMFDLYEVFHRFKSKNAECTSNVNTLENAISTAVVSNYVGKNFNQAKGISFFMPYTSSAKKYFEIEKNKTALKSILSDKHFALLTTYVNKCFYIGG